MSGQLFNLCGWYLKMRNATDRCYFSYFTDRRRPSITRNEYVIPPCYDESFCLVILLTLKDARGKQRKQNKTRKCVEENTMEMEASCRTCFALAARSSFHYFSQKRKKNLINQKTKINPIMDNFQCY